MTARPPPTARATAAIWACNVGATAGVGGTQALAYGWEALELARVANDDELLVMTLKLLGDVVVTGGDPTTGLALLEEAAALTASRTDPWSRATHASRGRVVRRTPWRPQAAEPLMHTALDLYEEIGVGWAVATVGGNLAMIAERQGDIDAAIQFAERARLAARPLRLGAYDAIMLARLGDYALWKGDRAGADEYPSAGRRDGRRSRLSDCPSEWLSPDRRSPIGRRANWTRLNVTPRQRSPCCAPAGSGTGSRRCSRPSE